MVRSLAFHWRVKPFPQRSDRRKTVISVSVSVDVPSLEEGIRFYRDAFGLGPAMHFGTSDAP
jgi:hypothetical protein